MNVQVLGCSHHNAPLAVREQLAFNSEQVCSALRDLRKEFPGVEAVLLSTCNRVELYAACENGESPSRRQIAEFLARRRALDPAVVFENLYERVGHEAVRHLFIVACSLDSMVVGEPQILSQVKQAYMLATRQEAIGPLTHAVFQSALKVARRVASETTIHQRRVSIPSVAVVDFAQQIFERFDDKQTLVIGAGEMAEETLRCLRQRGAGRVTIVNRSTERAEELSQRWEGQTRPWSELIEAIADADMVVSTTGAAEPIITRAQFHRVEAARHGRPLFILDLAVPRDFDPAIGDRPGVYLYALDDLQQVCQQNRRDRDRELPTAMKIIETETEKFVAQLHHRTVGPIVARLRRDWETTKEAELQRLLNKLPALDAQSRGEIECSFDRLVNKLLHPPMESLRVESRRGLPGTLLDSLAKLFQLKD